MKRAIIMLLLFSISHYEILIGLGFGVMSYILLPSNILASIGTKLMEPIINVAAISMGYLGALIAILYATPPDKLKRLQTSVIGINWVQTTTKSSIIYCFIMALASCSILVIDFQSISCCKRIILCVWIAIVFATVVSICKLSKLAFALITPKKSS